MSSTNLLKILLLVFIVFALGEIIFIIQHYGLPKFNLNSKPVAGPCKILEEEYCSKTKLTHIKDSQGKEFPFVGANLPANTPIFTPFDAQISKTPLSINSTFKGYLIRIGDPNLDPSKPTIFIRGDFRFDDMLTRNLKKGDIIGYTQDTGVKNYGTNFFLETNDQETNRNFR